MCEDDPRMHLRHKAHPDELDFALDTYDCQFAECG